MAKKYLMGLDLGTNSVGWCVTDENNHIIKKGGKSLWGVRLFKEAKDCKSRRANRAARRRTQRRAERIDLLQILFKEEVDKVDKNFFLRLNESFYKPEDKSEQIRNDNNYLFVDKDFNDKDYKKKYPTIYHLRKALYEANEKMDIRLIYLALAHMIKYRGNFLYEGQSFKPSDIETVKSLLPRINETLSALGEKELELKDGYASEFNEKVLKARGITGKKEALVELFGKDSYLSNVVYPLMAGGKLATKKIFEPEDDEEIDPKDFTFSSADADEKLEKLSELFPNDLHIELLGLIRGIYDYLLIGKLLGDSTTLSEAMVKKYEEHNVDLNGDSNGDLIGLKKYVKTHLSMTDYNEIFRLKGESNYVAYVGSTNSSDGKFRCSHCDRDAFYKYIKEKLGIDKVKKAESIEDSTLRSIYEKIEDETYLARQNSTDNGVFPYQLNKTELRKILETQSKYYPFLNKKDEYGTTIDKIESLLTFKIPYYVGPLFAGDEGNARGSHSWVVRNSKEKIYPWNFKYVVNQDESAEKFIKRMLNRCTYLPDCYCLPLNSLLFQRYQVLSLLNKTMINGALISKKDKDGLIEGVFKKNMSVSKKKILEYFTKNYAEDVSATTSNGKELEEVNASMSSYVFFSNALGEDFVKNNEDKIESIIKDLTIFEDSKIIEKRLKSNYGLNPDQIKKIKGKRLTGWGRLSKELLEMTTDYSNEYGEVLSISLIDLMERTNFNLMELINDDSFDFKKKIEEANQKVDYNFASKKEKHQAIVDFVDDCYVSPGMKRPLIQAMAIIEDVEKIIGHPIDEYYVECTRSNKAKKGTKDSRQKDLIKKYDEAKKLTMSAMVKESFDKAYKELKGETDLGKFRSDRFYLYLTQMGKCAYTLQDIDLAELFNEQAYDIDHIVPQSLVKDDSIENRVLVKAGANRDKKDYYPVPASVKVPGANAFYKMLLKAKLIGEKKYSNLTRTSQLTQDELLSFVNRQLVYTNQAVKALVDVLRVFQKDEKGNTPKVVYSKAENVSDFRRDFKIIKVREANNLHHAHDAYLNICVGRAVNTYFGDIRQRMIEKKWHSEKTLNVKKLFEDNENKDRKPLLDSEGNTIWDYKKSISVIRNNIFHKHDILSTTMQYVGNGSLTKKMTIYPAGNDKEMLFPVKTKGPLSDISRYGGRKNVAKSFYVLIDRKVNNKTLTTVVPVPLPYSKDVNKYLNLSFGTETQNVLISCLRINSILKIGSSKVCITGFSGESMLLKNLVEPIFSEDNLLTIKKVEKILGIISEKQKNIDLSKVNLETQKIEGLFALKNNGAELIISPASNRKASEVSLSKKEVIELYDCFVEKLGKDYYSALTGAKSLQEFISKPETRESFLNKDFVEQCYLLSQILLVIGPSISLVNMSLIGGKSNVGRTRISWNLTKDMSIVVESPTGFYSKVLWKGQ